MPIIVLTEPFIRHYNGSVFQVSDAIGISGWDDDDRVRDRQPCHDKRVYELPDNGRGIACELPLDFTIVCPDKLFVDVDLKSGPCRITSVSEGLKKDTNDPFYANPLPLGYGKIWYKDSQKYTKNILSLDLNLEEQPDTANIINRRANEIATVVMGMDKTLELCFDDFDPGFYEVSLMKSTQKIHEFTMIKCFPMVVEATDIRSKYKITKTLW